MTNRPTSRLLQGNFNALRATKSHSAFETIDIAAGNYSTGKFFPGVAGVSDASWVGATETFFIFIDKDDSLVLDAYTGFSPLSTRIAQVVIVSGIIFDIVDERAEVNGLIDAYQIVFDDTTTVVAVGDSVQDAIEALDGYVASVTGVGQDLVKFLDFDVESGVKNGLVKVSHDSDSPMLDFTNRPNGIGRVRYSASVPNDYVSGTDIVVKLFWSPSDGTAGDVRWRVRYRLVASTTENIDTAMTTVSFNQAAPAVANRLTDTGSNLSVSSGDISAGDILIFNTEREHTAADTYADSARVHLVRIEYTGRGIT